MLKFYLAGMFSLKEQIASKRVVIENLGHKVTSRWLDEAVSGNTKLHEVTEDYLRTHAHYDIEDIDACDVFVLFSVDPSIPTVRGGRHVETGYAYGVGKPIVVIGPRENIFHYLDEVVQFNSFEEFLKQLEADNAAQAFKTKGE